MYKAAPDFFGTRRLAESADLQFSNRQGQLEPSAGRRPPARAAPQGPRPTPAQQVPQGPQARRPQQEQFRTGTGQELQPRFQRLRTPPGGSPDQFLAPAGPAGQQQQAPNLVPMPPMPQLNFGSARPAPAQSPSAPANGLPTLSAFDLSSLANLANQAAGQFNQGQQAFRRIPQQQQSAPGRGSSFAEQTGASQRNPVPNGPASSVNGFPGSQTELPFIRQVFRPAPGPSGDLGSPADSAGGQLEADRSASSRPTPPPLFVPGRPATLNKIANSARLVETGFAPMQAGREVFFEPQSNRNLMNTNNQANRLMRQPANNGLSSPTPAATLAPQQVRPQQAANGLSPGALEPTKKPAAVRRPSQRPQLSRQVSEQALKPVLAPQALQTSAPDVIRLASSAIQAANQGLAAISSSEQPGQSGLFSAPVSTEASTTGTLASFSASSPPSSFASDQSSPASSTQPGVATSTEDSQSTRRAVPPSPPRSSANFFTMTALGATSSPASPFSPALPINAAVAASGGRRRIPVRNSQPTTASARAPAVAATLGPAAAATTTTTAATATTTTTLSSAARTLSSVRRPEIEEFYETVGQNGLLSSLNNPAAGNIDGFGASGQAQSSTNSPLAPSSESSANAADLYGSRLSASGSSPSDSSSTGEPSSTSTESGSPAAPPRAAVFESPAEVSPSELAKQPPSSAPVMVPVTYMTTLTYLTTVLHGTHTLETSHESVVKSTELATLNAQLMDQIEHRLPLIEPTATLSLSSKTKGKGTTIVNLKSAVSAYNQELVEALGVGGNENSAVERPTQVEPTSVLGAPAEPSASSQPATTRLTSNKFRQPARANQAQRAPSRGSTRTVDLAELERAKKSLLTEYVYLYTLRPVASDSGQAEVTSVRSELLSASLDSAQLMNELMAGSAPGIPQLIDSEGILRLSRPGGEPPAGGLNLGKSGVFDRASCLSDLALDLWP